MLQTHLRFIFVAFIDPMEDPHFPNDEKWSVKMEEGIMHVIDTELGCDISLPEISRERFIGNRNLLYALVADGPLYVRKF